tara:strand:+ start:389 stop:589 length:201 start_codon:yes stop_codon:yes gene_type:complete
MQPEEPMVANYRTTKAAILTEQVCRRRRVGALGGEVRPADGLAGEGVVAHRQPDADALECVEDAPG